MTIEEAIKHCEEVADSKCDVCGAEHRQLAEWLKELKERRNGGSKNSDAREDFMFIVYNELSDDADNNRVNRIIDAADVYADSSGTVWEKIT